MESVGGPERSWQEGFELTRLLIWIIRKWLLYQHDCRYAGLQCMLVLSEALAYDWYMGLSRG